MTFTIERLREVLDYDPDTGLFRWAIRLRRKPLGSVAGVARKNGRRVIGIDGAHLYASRLAWLYMTGNWPVCALDHIDGNPGNDRFANLREATHGQNMQNLHCAKSHNSTKILGVHKHQSGLWRARITFERKQIHIGYYKNQGDAYDAYVKAKRQLHAFGTL